MNELPCWWSHGALRGGTEDLADAIVVKPDRNTSRREEYGYTISNNDGICMINLEAIPAMQFGGENLERLRCVKALRTLSKFSAVMLSVLLNERRRGLNATESL
jgi:hypothetical protein